MLGEFFYCSDMRFALVLGHDHIPPSRLPKLMVATPSTGPAVLPSHPHVESDNRRNVELRWPSPCDQTFGDSIEIAHSVSF